MEEIGGVGESRLSNMMTRPTAIPTTTDSDE
jgi:hypothetical protein